MHMVSGAALERWTGLTDEDIVTRVLQGQIALFEVLMRRHNERIYRAARAILRDDREVEDVMQQAYVNAYAHLRQFDGRAAFVTWLTRIAVHEAIARARKQGRYEPLDSEGDALETISPEARVRILNGLRSRASSRCCSKPLSTSFRTDAARFSCSREVQGLNTSETAAVLGVSDDVVKTRLSRAKATLRRDLLERAGFGAPHTFSFHQSRCDRVVAAVFGRIGAV